MTLGYKTVGIVGLGKLGGSITERLLNSGTKINMYNRDKTKLKVFENTGAKSFDNVCALANESDFIMTCVTNFESLKDVLFNKQGIAESTNGELIVADCNNYHPKPIMLLRKTAKGKKWHKIIKCASNGRSI